MSGPRPLLAAGLLIVLAHAPGLASDFPALRAVGWFKGKAEITAGRINCEIPSVTNAISEGSFSLGLWNTYGTQTIDYPDPTNPFANPCGVWLQLRNDLFTQAVLVDRIEVRFRIQNFRTFLATVPTQRHFPYDCRTFRRQTVFIGSLLNPSDGTGSSSSSGAPNVAFVEMLPFVSPQLISCLRAMYASHLTGGTNTLMLVARATATGRSDSGSRYRSNTIGYTLTLRHTCGNGRVDDGELCDPTAPSTCAGICTGGHCSQDDRVACTADADCVGSCLGADVPSECTCAYGG